MYDDPRFSYVSGFGKPGVRTMYPRERSADTPQALFEIWRQDVFDAEVIAGRRDRNGAESTICWRRCFECPDSLAES
jgi:hypothetical protein